MNQPLPHPVGVRTLGEYVFCPRAGIVAASLTVAEEEPEYDEPRLDFLPQYSLTMIELQLGIRLRRFGQWSAAAGAALFLLLGCFLFGAKVGAAASAVALFVLARFWVKELRAVMTLADYRQQALRTSPKEPPIDLKSATAVNWWELLNAGFDLPPVHEPLRDEASGLVGRPWRVLRKGSLRIPVIKLEARNFEGGRFWVYPQHEIRLAAYARVLAACEGGETPYGVLLFGDRFDGVAVPIGEELQRAVNATIASFRQALRDAEVENPPPEPADRAICSGCPLGLPRLVTDADRRNAAKKIHGVKASDGKLYHSDCGDAFCWRPPHRVARRKGLLPPGE